MPLATLAPVVGPAGISAPSYDAILASMRESFRSIYGNDIYIEPDSQDGQLLALVAAAINDSNNTAIAVYNSFSPSYAQGAGLSSVVKINGIRRLSSSFSTAVGTVTGVYGTDINYGAVSDANGNVWNLPALVTIPVSGSVDVTITAQQPGSIVAPAGTIDQIATPVRGWQSFVSTDDALPGQPVETDAELRRRQTISTSLPAQTPLAALYGALADLANVERVRVYENPTNAPDGDGLPAHSISVVISGGDVGEIARTIGQKKTPGAATYGTTTQSYEDPITGITQNINFFVLADAVIKVAVTGVPLAGYNSTIDDEIKAAIAAYINSLDIGEDVQFSRMYPPAYLNGAAHGLAYKVTDITIALGAGMPGTADIVVPFNKAAASDPAVDITVNIA